MILSTIYIYIYFIYFSKNIVTREIEKILLSVSHGKFHLKNRAYKFSGSPIQWTILLGWVLPFNLYSHEMLWSEKVGPISLRALSTNAINQSTNVMSISQNPESIGSPLLWWDSPMWTLIHNSKGKPISKD